jgi:hypothetical protein
MTEAEWTTAPDPQAMLSFLSESGKLSDRKARLYAAACCRRVWPLLTDERSRTVIEVAERYADGVESVEEFDLAARDAWHALLDLDRFPNRATWGAANAAASIAPYAPSHQGHGPPQLWGALGVPVTVAVAVYDGTVNTPMPTGELEDENPRTASDEIRTAFYSEYQSLAAMVRDLFGQPHRSVTTEACRLTPAVLNLAKRAYEDRILPLGTLNPDLLGQLADALADAGCEDAALVGHLRGGGPHVRGCHALDAILGKG